MASREAIVSKSLMGLACSDVRRNSAPPHEGPSGSVRRNLTIGTRRQALGGLQEPDYLVPAACCGHQWTADLPLWTPPGRRAGRPTGRSNRRAAYNRLSHRKSVIRPERSQWPRRLQSRIPDGRYGRQQSGGHIACGIA